MYEFWYIDRIVEDYILYIDTMFVIQFPQMIVRWSEEDKNVVFFLRKIFEHNILAMYLSKQSILCMKIKATKIFTCFTESLKSTFI
jgi:hypothetical protein